MAVYVVTWNLNRERSNYSAARTTFITNLERYDNKADSSLESVRFVSTGQTAEQLSDNLRTKLDQNDRLFVSKLNSGYHAGWLDKDVWDWINARL